MENAKVTFQYGRLRPDVNQSEVVAQLGRDMGIPGSSARNIADGASRDTLPSLSTFSSNNYMNDSSTVEGGYSAPMDASDSPGLLGLSSELIDLIFSFLSPRDLDRVACTCQLLYEHTIKELYWQDRVQDSVPGCKVTSPNPFSTYRELYRCHDPHWFLTKYKIWFSDYFLTGKLILARYDPRRGCIEGYRLVAERGSPEFEHWEYDPEVIIHSFEPKVQLHMDLPVLHISATHREDSNIPGDQLGRRQLRRVIELPINTDVRQRQFYYFELARRVREHPNMELWPPHTIPARHRVRNATQQQFKGMGHQPQSVSDVSDQAFRIRRWMNTAFETGTGRRYPRIGEEVDTYATLDPSLYTPTAEKPYRGIWVGDYSAHGCEFLLMHQPDDETAFESAVVQRDDETFEEFTARRRQERMYRGRIEAIKLTGDPNVPRGEHTFIADDIGPDGFVRVAEENRFKGARIVRSRGHIAEALHRNDTYIESQLIMISPDKLAQYWVGFGHISFYERVRIDDFLDPYKSSIGGFRTS